MTPDPKAPPQALVSASEALPDEVAGLPADPDAANRLISIAMRELKRKKDKGGIAARITLDHIAAQAEKIAALELEVADLKNINATVYKSGRMDEAAQMGHKSRTDDEIIAGFHKSHQHQAKQIAALEAENKRLREALIKWEDCYANNGRTTSIHDWDLLLREARRTGKAALAQTGDE